MDLLGRREKDGGIPARPSLIVPGHSGLPANAYVLAPPPVGVTCHTGSLVQPSAASRYDIPNVGSAPVPRRAVEANRTIGPVNLLTSCRA